MQRFLTLAIACAALASSIVCAHAAPAKPNRIKINYVLPKAEAHKPIHARLVEERFLEQVQKFLGPLRLPRTLLVELKECDEANAWYENNAITICYEYIDEVWKTVPATPPLGLAHIDVLAGPLFDTVLHETGHAIFELLKIPVFGREEDAADQVAAYVQLQLGRDHARRLIAGTAYAYYREATAEDTDLKAKPRHLNLKRFSDVHGTPGQRFYNSMCIAYGADKKLFADFVTTKRLPEDRAEFCESEYQQAARAFKRLVWPHVDPKLAKNVLKQDWLPPVTAPVKRRPK